MEISMFIDFWLLLRYSVLLAGGRGHCTGLPRERCSGLYSLLAMTGMPLKSAFTSSMFLIFLLYQVQSKQVYNHALH
jgi:hypothetical protein